MNGEKSANKAFPSDTEETVGEVGKSEQSQKQIAGTTNVVQTEPGLEALKELASYVNAQCTQLWNSITKGGFLVYHVHRDVSRKITEVVEDVCNDARDDFSFRRCLIAYHVMGSVLLGRTEHGEALCPLVQRLIEDERKGASEIRRELTDIVNATIRKLDFSPEHVKEIERKAIENIMDGKLYVDIVIERIILPT